MMNERMLSAILKLLYLGPLCYEVLDFNRDFFLYTFTSDQSLAAVLTQKDDDNNEALVLFMSTNLQGVNLTILLLTNRPMRYTRQ
jgi:hypothetical protein